MSAELVEMSAELVEMLAALVEMSAVLLEISPLPVATIDVMVETPVDVAVLAVTSVELMAAMPAVLLETAAVFVLVLAIVLTAELMAAMSDVLELTAAVFVLMLSELDAILLVLVAIFVPFNVPCPNAAFTAAEHNSPPDGSAV
jgi:hypothetical protein